MDCRACTGAVDPVVDLGSQPASARFPDPSSPPDITLPLRLGVCRSCGLGQLAGPSLPQFDEPGAPSPLSSTTMTAHARAFAAELASALTSPANRVLSLASHGGHLAPFLRQLGVPAATGDESLGVAEGLTGPFDLVVDNYLLAHLDRPGEALARLAGLLAPGGTLVLEFDDLTATVEGRQWDAIGAGHPLYLTLAWVERALAATGLTIFDASRQPVYGGAIRAYARRGATRGGTVNDLLARDHAARIDRPEGLGPLAHAIEEAQTAVVSHLREAAAGSRRVVGYGAPGRAITFLNALGIDATLLPFVVDRSTAKHGRAIPGVRVPIRPVTSLAVDRPDEVLILTWNLLDEVREALEPLVAQGTRLYVAIPALADVTHASTG